MARAAQNGALTDDDVCQRGNLSSVRHLRRPRSSTLSCSSSPAVVRESVLEKICFLSAIACYTSQVGERGSSRAVPGNNGRNEGGSQQVGRNYRVVQRGRPCPYVRTKVSESRMPQPGSTGIPPAGGANLSPKKRKFLTQGRGQHATSAQKAKSFGGRLAYEVRSRVFRYI